MAGLLTFAVSIVGICVEGVYQQVERRPAHVVETPREVGSAADGRHRPQVEM